MDPMDDRALDAYRPPHHWYVGPPTPPQTDLNDDPAFRYHHGSLDDAVVKLIILCLFLAQVFMLVLPLFAEPLVWTYPCVGLLVLVAVLLPIYFSPWAWVITRLIMGMAAAGMVLVPFSTDLQRSLGI